MRRKFSQTFVSIAFLATVSVACGQAGQQNSESKIYGGTKVAAGGWPSTIALTQNGSIFCSGTAIAPTVVITAGHCNIGSASSIKVYVGDGVDGGNFSGQYAVSKIETAPGYQGESGEGNDLSYVVLKTPLTLKTTDYVKVLTDKTESAELLKVGNTGHIVGFGLRSSTAIGLKYEVDAPIVSKLSTLGYDKATEVAVGGNGKDSCNGDSGGPVYGKLKTGEWRVYGVTSRGGSCGTGGIYGIISANVCWVQSDSGIDLGLGSFCGGSDNGDTGSNNGNTGSNNGNTGSNNGNTGSNNGNTGSNNGNTGSNNGNTGSNNGNNGSNNGSTSNDPWCQLFGWCS